MSDHKDPPIIEGQYLGGVTVVDIGDIRVARGMSRRPFSTCSHHSMVYDQRERRIWCKDCENDVDAFDAFEMLAKRSHEHRAMLDAREQKIEEAEAFTIRSVAAKVMDKAWRRRKTVPTCPHCRSALLPEDVENGFNFTSKEIELARRKRAHK